MRAKRGLQILRIVPVAVLLMAACSICQGAEATVTGTVRDRGTGQPIPYAQLTFRRADGSYTEAANASGVYQFHSMYIQEYSRVEVYGLNHLAQDWFFSITTPGVHNLDFNMEFVDGTDRVEAGPPIDVVAPSPRQVVRLAGIVENPDSWPRECWTRWETVSGPGAVEYTDALDPQTTATFNGFGSYVLQLRLYNKTGEGWISDSVTVAIQGLTVNECPEVYAGVDIEVGYPFVFLRLDGTAYDPDSGPDASAKPVWREVSGPGDVGFVNPNDPKTQATFSEPGEYVLELYYYDGQCEAADRVTVKLTEIPPPLVGGKPAPPSTPDLEAASDTGVSSTDDTTSDHTPIFVGTADNGCTVTIYSDGAAVGSGSVVAGVYTITTGVLGDGVHRITARATDTDGGTSDESGALMVTIQTGSTGNQCPTADAGPASMEATVGQALTLQGSASDPDNGPQALAIEWSQVSGPGIVSFGNKADPRTTATFSTAGTYVLRLWCNDGVCSHEDTVTVEVKATTTGGACELLAYWDFEEGSGAVAYDLSGHGHNGALFGGPQWATGYDGGALKFDGVNDYADTGINQDLARWSICCWVSSPAAPSADAPTGPIHREQNFQINWNHGDANFRAAAALNVGGTWYAARLGTLSANTWYHLAATYDGVSLKAYRDGALITTTPCAGTPAPETHSLKLGKHADMPYFFAGTIDEVYLYGCALAQDRIKALMAGPAMTIREVIDNGVVSSQQACIASLDSGKGSIVEYTRSVLDIHDSGPRGHYGWNHPFEVVARRLRSAGGVDHLSLLAEGVLRIPPGQGGYWTFGVNSDDGFTLMIPGRSFTLVTNGERAVLPGGTAMRVAGGRGAVDSLGVINLPAGDHGFWLTYHEEAGAAEVELFAARGARTAFDSEVFRLIGQKGIGTVGMPGLCGEVTMVATPPKAWAGGLIDSLADAKAALAALQHTSRSGKYAFVSHIDPDTAGSDAGMFPAGVAFPNDVVGKDDDDFAVKVTGQLDIRADGVYQIGFNSDDGASLRITGKTWQSIVADGTGGAQISGDELINDAISGNTLTAGQISLKAGCHAFEAVMFERAGGSYFELLGRGVSNKGIADPTWHLLRSGGAQSSAQVAGLKLVWPAGMP